jgi:hypothetical protein
MVDGSDLTLDRLPSLRFCLDFLRPSLQFLLVFVSLPGALSSLVGWGTMLQVGRSPVRVPGEMEFFNLPNPSNRSMFLGPTEPLTEMSTRNICVGIKGGRRVRLTNLSPSVSRLFRKMWESRRLTILKASTTCTRITLPLPLYFITGYQPMSVVSSLRWYGYG